MGNSTALGSKDAAREAFSDGIISDGETWMEMIRSRNMTSHIYSEKKADKIYVKIMIAYHPVLLKFKELMEEKNEEK